MNTSGSYHGAVGVKLKKHKGGKGNTQKLPAELKTRMAKPKQEQQEIPGLWLSAYGKRRKSKMQGI